MGNWNPELKFHFFIKLENSVDLKDQDRISIYTTITLYMLLFYRDITKKPVYLIP